MARLGRSRRAGWLAALLCVAVTVQARPYEVEDMLRTEAFGRILVSPDGRWLVFERRIALAAAPRFDLDALDAVRDRLYRVDLRRPAAAEPLLPGPSDAGMVALGFSPDGTHLAVGRLEGKTWTLGVVTVATGAVRWFALSPDYFPFRTTVQWASKHQLVLIAQPGRALPWLFRTNLDDAHALPSRWAAAQAGRQPTVTAIGSGADRAITPVAPSERLILLDVRTGRERLLAQGDLLQLSVSPDGRKVALLRQAEPIQATASGPIREEIDLRRRRLAIFDLATGSAWVPCPACDLPAAPPLWSDDGGRLLFYARRDGERWTDGMPLVADAARRRTRTPRLDDLACVVIETSGDYDRPALGWSGGAPLVFAHPRGTARADWYRLGAGAPRNLTSPVGVPSPRLTRDRVGAPLMLAPDGAWRLHADATRRLPEGHDRLAALVPFAGAMADARVRILASERGSFAVARTGEHPAPYRIDAAGELVPLAASRDAIVLTAAQANGVEALVVAQRSGPTISVATINRHLTDVDPPVPVALHHRLPGGAAAISWLYLPRASADGTPPPLIAIPYPGDVQAEAPPPLWWPGRGQSYTNVHALVGHGFAVLVPSMPPLAPVDDAPFDFAGQLMPAIEAAIATGMVDPARLGLWGHSYGAFAAATIAAQTDRFRAIVASNGIYDLTSFHGAFMPRTRLNPGFGLSILPWAGWVESEQPRLAATPWSNSARYVANSPIYHAGRITAPMLLIAGDRDFAQLQQSEQLFAALYRQGKDAELLTYWGEDHVLVSPANIRDNYARIFAWFDDHFREGVAAAATLTRRPLPGSRRSDRSTPAPTAPPATP